jgi:ribonuclease E
MEKLLTNSMLINFIRGEECRIAVVENNRLEELFIERTSAESRVGNIYKGKVTNVEPSIQAAFIDFGFEKNGFLHVSDLHPQYFPHAAANGAKERMGQKTPRRHRPPIQQCLKRGHEVIVQVTKEGIGSKGPTLTTYLSIPGRYLVMMPGMDRLGVSRKIEDEEARKKLRQLVGGLELPSNMGFIIRTAGIDRNKRELQADLSYLRRLWKVVENRMKISKAPGELYQESDIVTRTIRDIYSSEIDKIIVDDPDIAKKARDFLGIVMPRNQDQVILHDNKIPLFYKYGIEEQIAQINSRRVALPSGGSLVIDQTEALVAIDVNSGKFRDPSDPESMALEINLSAADEVVRQLRLRDLGGLIVIDFIDMREERNRRNVERQLRDAMKRDRAKTKTLKMSMFGIVEMTRQRMRTSLGRSISNECPHCGGMGQIKRVESVGLDIMRLVQLAMFNDRVEHVQISAPAAVCEYLQNRRRRAMVKLEEETRKKLDLFLGQDIRPDAYTIKCFDGRDQEVNLESLTEAAVAQVPEKRSRGGRSRRRNRANPPEQATLAEELEASVEEMK